MRPFLTTVVAASTLALTLSACSASAGDATDRALKIVGPFEVHSLDPIADGEIFNRLEVTETLLTADVEGRLVAGLAESWKVSDDDLTWTFDLVDDVTFHNGTPLTGEDVADSLNRVTADDASLLAGVPIEGITGDAETVTVELAEPSATLPSMLAHYSTQILSPDSYDGSGQVTEIIGTGPYEVADVKLPAAVSVEAADTWRGETPDVRRVEFQAVSRAETRAVMATSGQADVVFGLEPAGQASVDADDRVDLVTSLQPRTLMLKANAKHPALSDVRVRRAISLAMDREAMAEAVLREEELAASELFPPSLTDWHTDGDQLGYDPKAAADLLTEAGWVAAGDGKVRAKGKTPLQLELLTYADRPELPPLATAIQESLRKVGIDVKVNVTNSSEIPADHEDGSLDLALFAKSFALVPDPLVDVAAVFNPEGDAWGTMNWSDDEMTAAIADLQSGAAGTQADQDRATVSRVALEQLPVIPVSWYRMNAAVSERVDGFVLDPLETTWRLSGLSWA